MSSVSVIRFGSLATILVALTVGLSAAAQEAPRASFVRAYAADIRQALAENRLVDAGRLLDISTVNGVRDPLLDLLSAQYDLARNKPADALQDVQAAENVADLRAEALQVKGVALAQLSRGPEAIPVLTEAVSLDARQWRAWNALGSQYDAEGNYEQAAAAYDKAAAASNNAPAVLNNRGYSRLIQGQIEEAVADFVRALEKSPGSPTIRTNLRIALAARGDYARATAAGAGDDKAVLLNNAGFGAVLRGDYDQAERLFADAQSARGAFYDHAAANLRLASELASRATLSRGGQ